MGRSLIGDVGIYSVGSMLRRGFGFFLIPIYTRYLSLDEYGMLALLNVILQLVSYVYLLGLSSASMRYYFDPEADEQFRRELYGNSFLLLLVFPILILCLIFPLMYFVLDRFLDSIPFFPYIFIVLIMGLFTPLHQLLLGLYRVRGKAKVFVVYSVCLFLAQTILIILAVTFLDLGLIGVLVAQLITYVIFCLIAVYLLKQYVILRFSWNISRKILWFGIPLIPSFIFMWVDSASPRFLLDSFGSLEEVAIFTLAFQFSQILLIFSLASDNAIIPYFYKTARESGSAEILGIFSTKYFAAFGIIAVFTLLVAKPLVMIMADPKYHEAVAYVPLLIVMGWLMLVFKVFHWSLLYAKKTGTLSFIMGISAVCLIVFISLSLNRTSLGINGVILAIIAVFVAKNIMGYILARRSLKIHYNFSELGLIFLLVATNALQVQFLSFGESQILTFIGKSVVFILLSFLTVRAAKLNIHKYWAFARSFLSRHSAATVL